MSRMIRKQLYLEERQQQKVARLARATGRTEAEVVRTAIDAVPDTDAVAAKLDGARLLAPPPALPEAPLHVQRSELEATVHRLPGPRIRTLRLSDAALAERSRAPW